MQRLATLRPCHIDQITYIFHNDRALPRSPIPMLDTRQPLVGIHLYHFRRQWESAVGLDVLVWDLLDFEGDPYTLREGTEQVAEEDEVGRLRVMLSRQSGEAGGGPRLGRRHTGVGC